MSSFRPTSFIDPAINTSSALDNEDATTVMSSEMGNDGPRLDRSTRFQAHGRDGQNSNNSQNATTPREAPAQAGLSEQGSQAPYASPASRSTTHARVISFGSETVDSSSATSTEPPRPATTGNRTHIPSLTSRAFFAPMSSQRLQAHRSQRPSSQVHYRPRMSEELDDGRSATNRNSTGSVITSRGPAGASVQHDVDVMPPMSRGTDYTSGTQDGRTVTSAEFERAVAPSTRQASLEPLQQRREPPAAIQVDARQSTEQYQATVDARDATPRSFMAMSSFKRSSRQSVNGTLVNGLTNGHSRLPSEPSPPLGVMEEKTREVKKDLGRNYEYFTGKTVFFFGGRWQNARAKPVVLVTGLIIIVPSALFFGFSAPWLWHHSSPAIPILYAYIFYICMSSFIHASVSNPGILPRNLHTQQMPDPSVDPLAVQAHNRWTLVKSETAKHGLFEIPTKYCSTCNLWRPPRCHHCRICDNCVETQDHHCVWLNNCVGRRNYRYFFTFVSSGALLGVYLFSASIGHVVAWAHHNNTSVSRSINHNRVPFAMFIYGLLAFAYPLALCGYHTFLINRGQTTHEFLNSTRFRELDRHRPFNQKSWWKNIVVVLFRARPPTYLRFKSKYEEGDQRLGQRRGHGTTAGTTAPLASGQQSGGGVEMHQLRYPSTFPEPRSRAPVDVTPR